MLAIKDQDLSEIRQIAQTSSSTVPAVREYLNLVENNQINIEPWSAAPEKHRQTAQQREVLCLELDRLINTLSLHRATDELPRSNNHAVITAIHALNHPSKGTLRNWYNAWKDEGKQALLPAYTGTKRKTYGWEPKFLELYHEPQKPSIAKIARKLRKEYGYRDATEHNVRYFYSLLPANLQDKSPWRLGRKQYRDGVQEFTLRTTENLPVGFLYQGDGHCCDVYLKHPVTGNLWRAELVVFMDITSRFIVGWYLCVAESAINTMAALSNALCSWDHVNAMVHIDRGSGFFGKLMNDDTAGFYASFGMKPIFALPGNPKAKNIERFFRTMEDDFGKDFATYCGYDMSPDAAHEFFRSAAQARKMEQAGKIKVPTAEEWCEKFRDWLDDYHNRPHPEFKDRTPASMWGELQRVPVHDHQLLVKPREVVNVRRSMIVLHKRYYRHDSMYQFEGRELIAEYDLHDDSTIRVFDKDGVWLFTAELKVRKDYLPASRMEEAEITRRDAALKRLDNKKREVAARAGIYDQRDTQKEQQQLSHLAQSALEMEQAKAPANDESEMKNFNPDELLQEGLSEASESDCEFDINQLINDQE